MWINVTSQVQVKLMQKILTVYDEMKGDQYSFVTFEQTAPVSNIIKLMRDE